MSTTNTKDSPGEKSPLEAERKQLTKLLDAMAPVSQLSTVLGLVHAAAKDLVSKIVAEEETRGPVGPEVMATLNRLTQMLLVSASVSEKLANNAQVAEVMRADRKKLLNL